MKGRLIEPSPLPAARLYRFLLVVAAVIWTAGCATPTEPAFTAIAARRVAKIVIADTSKHDPIFLKAPSGRPLTNDGEAGGLPWTDTPFTECVTITNRTIIAELVQALNPSGPVQSGAMTFDSILAHQYFFDKHGMMIAHVRVICLDSSVLVSVGNERLVSRAGQPHIRTTNWPRLAALRRPQYSRMIYDLMKPGCASRIDFLRDLYQKRGLVLEDRLFGKSAGN